MCGVSVQPNEMPPLKPMPLSKSPKSA